MVSKNKRKQTFKEEYSRSWDFIKPSRKGENHARCTLCSADFSIAASGRYDITQHIATAKHRSNAERKDSNQSILQFVSSKSNDYDTIRAETLWTLYVVEHNMPFTSSDSFSDIAKVMFPDSKVAHEFSCRRTKTTAIARTMGQETRIFSVVRKNATEFRSNLSTPVLSDTLITKMYWQAAGVPCHKRVLTNDLLAKCKKATMESNKRKP